MRASRRLLAAGLVAVAAALAGCGIQIPSDPDGTLDRVTGGTLRAGATHHPPHTDTSSAAPTGREIDLVASFAESIDADVVWTVGSEEQLVGMLEEGELDLVVGGFSDRTPWAEQAALTRPYADAPQPDGATRGLVMLTPMGENAFLSALERHLDEATR